MLSAGELSKIRTDLEAQLMPDTCTILSVTRASDGAGGWTDTWGTATAAVACRVDGVNANERVAGGELQPFHLYVLTLPHGTAITTENRVVVNSETFAVNSVDEGKSWSACVRAYLERV